MSFDVKHEGIVHRQIHKLLAVFVRDFTLVDIALCELINFQPRALLRLHDDFSQTRRFFHGVLYVPFRIGAC